MDTQADGQRQSGETGTSLFRFAILADTHMNPRDGETSSPWLTNRQANDRARAVVREINRLAPAFTVHLGDIVHPVPAQETFVEAAERALATFAKLEMPIHYVAGNHDMGDKPLDWMPAEVVNDDFIAIYQRYFGADYYAFDHSGCRFVVLNAQILNSGMARERAQWQWLEKTLAEAGSKRLFVFSHYPLYIAAPDEREHYDNLGEVARTRLLALFERYRVEGFFAGHVHNFFFDRRNGTDMYVLPAVSAVRHDYSEMFRVGPGDSEHGRDDNAKLGFFVVDVHANGHVAHFVRSYGAVASDKEGDGGPQQLFRIPRVHSRLDAPCPVGVDLRQAWAEAVAITPSGAVDEFYRKKARNDYALVAMWEMGLRKLRVPVDDLLNEEARERLAVLRELGHEILLYGYEVPEGATEATLVEHANLFSALEFIVPSQRAAAAVAEVALLKHRTGLPVYLSRLRSSAEARAAGVRYTHFISHGFTAAEEMAVRTLIQQPEAAALDGVVFRVAANEDPCERITEIGELMSDLETRALVQLSLANENPALMTVDEATTSARVAAALFCAHGEADRCSVYLDTLADVDRGYFPRLGLVDRRYNPRTAGRVFGNLQAELGALGGLGRVVEQSIDGGRVLTASAAGQTLHLVQTSCSVRLNDVRLPAGPAEFGAVRIVDLVSGRGGTGTWIGQGDEGRLGEGVVAEAGRPLLIVAENQLADV